MDYKEEQTSEIEALESIYEGDLQVLDTDPRHVFTMPIKTEDYDDEDSEAGIYFLLKFSFTPKYPEELPLLEIEDEVNLDENELRQPLMDHLKEQMEENLGMVMGFTIISAATEWIGDKWDAIRTEEEERVKRQKEIEEEAEKRRLEGTKVTVESFMAWKAKFDEERLALKSVVKKEDLGLTGKEIFLSNDAMNTSDVNFDDVVGDAAAEVAGGASVEVDESLFDDLDDLDVGDSEDSLSDSDQR